MVIDKKIFTSEDISQLFGLRSSFFSKAIYFLENEVSVRESEFKDKFNKWKSIFSTIYGTSANKELFLKHTYFVLLLKSLLIIKLSLIQNLDYEDTYQDFIGNDLEVFSIFEFNRFFYWTDFSGKLFEKIYNTIELITFSEKDLFIDIYQQIFFIVTRHKIGEFYTPNKLVSIMVDDFYEFGKKILDPSCGSGNFLIDIIVKILNSENSEKLKIKAINRIYGFDVNPLATITAKINILLIFLEHFDVAKEILPNINIFLVDSLFSEKYEKIMNINLKNLYNSFDLIIGNPPWLTYKDLSEKEYQIKIRELAKLLDIKPSSQYITHIELAALFFYFIPFKFLKIGGKIFFVITKSVLNGDHCFKFRSFSLFNNLEIWDFPLDYFFNIHHICLKADYLGQNNIIPIENKYPIKTKVFDEELKITEETYYSSLKIENSGAKIILPEQHLKILNKILTSYYKNKFFQGATLVPRTLVFFTINDKLENMLKISSDKDILLRAKNKWQHEFSEQEIEKEFHYKTFLNKDLIPFLLKKERDIFLPINSKYELDIYHLKSFPKAYNFYMKMNEFYKKNKKNTSDINSLFSNLNYWNKLTKQINNKHYLVIYNASGSNIKSAVINNRKNKVIIGSENYYYSTDSKDEAYYLCGILNAPLLSNNIKLIKSSRHIHKRPFSFPIPPYDETNELHHRVIRYARRCESIALDLFLTNENINSDKFRIISNKKLMVLNDLIEKIVFHS